MIDLRPLLLVCMCALANGKEDRSEFPLWRTITGEGQARPPSERFIGRSSGTRVLVFPNDLPLPFQPFPPPVALSGQPTDFRGPSSNRLQYAWHPIYSYRSTPSNPRLSAPRPSDAFSSPTEPPTTTPQSGSLSLFDQYYKHGQGQWSLWSQWSPCVNNQRMRARGCYHSPSGRCHGSNMEKQKCTGGITVDENDDGQARDPWKEERELAAEQLGL